MRKSAILLTALLTVAFIIGVIGYGYTQETPAPEGGGTSSCCACASAYASTDDGRLNVIRQFRDRYLMTNPVGRGLAALYYNVFSPPVAHFINDYPAVKPVARVALSPVVAISTVAVDTTLAERTAILGSLALVAVVLVMWAKRRRSKSSQNS